MKLSDISLSSDKIDLPILVNQALLKPQDISPLSVYHTLKELFGEPNGTFDDSKSQWSYHLRVSGAYLEVYDWKLETWSVAVYEDSTIENIKQIFGSNKGPFSQELMLQVFDASERGDKAKAEKIGNEFLALLMKYIPKANSKIKKAEGEASQFVLQNPFALYHQSAVNLLNKSIDTNTTVESSDYYRSAFFLLIAAFEGLLNLIYELYLKTDLRDNRIYERLSREQIDIKVRLAPVYCDCFSNKSFEHNSEVFKQFHSIINLRNDFIHANFTKPMKRAIHIEDGHTFIIESSNRDKNGLPKSIDGLTRSDLELIEGNIYQMIEVLTDAMKPRFRREFRSILNELYIQIVIEDGEIIVVESG